MAVGSRVRDVRPTLRSAVYVAVVVVTATIGFAVRSPWLIGLAALLALPASVVTLPCYYLAYGVLALVPGANPASSTGSGTSTADGRTITSVTGEPAAWFTVTTHVLGVLLLTGGALLNVVLVRAVLARRRDGRPVPPQAWP